tara:strand:+ start:1735 stop:2184 length:450 start_codon:yes stop_codon:yes gene_type:complete
MDMTVEERNQRIMVANRKARERGTQSLMRAEVAFANEHPSTIDERLGDEGGWSLNCADTSCNIEGYIHSRSFNTFDEADEYLREHKHGTTEYILKHRSRDKDGVAAASWYVKVTGDDDDALYYILSFLRNGWLSLVKERMSQQVQEDNS